MAQTHYKQNNSHNNYKKQLPKINLGFHINEKDAVVLEDEELFSTIAKEWAEAINRTKKTQARNFYDKVLDLEKEIQDKGFDATYPFIKMLNSKVAYAVNRRVVSREFQEMMEQALKQIKNDSEGEQTFRNFKLFFEAVLGYFKGSN
jgi:CRISPR-associated protein Csm2